MSLSNREKQLLGFLALMLIVSAALLLWPEEGSTVAPVQSAGVDVEATKSLLEKDRATAMRLPALQDELKKAEAAIAAWDKRLLSADTPALAAAQLSTTVRKLVRAQGEAMSIRNSDIGSVLPNGEFADIVLNMALDCSIEGLLNFLADLTSQPELISWKDLRIASSDPKTKRLNVALTIMAKAQKKLLPKAVVNAAGGQK